MNAQIEFVIPAWLICLWAVSGLVTAFVYYRMEGRGRASIDDIAIMLMLTAGGPVVCGLVLASVVVPEYWERIRARLPKKIASGKAKVDRILDHPLSRPGLGDFLKTLSAHYQAAGVRPLPNNSRPIASTSLGAHYSALLISVALNKMYSRPWLAKNVQNRIAKAAGYKILTFQDHAAKDAAGAFPKILASYIHMLDSQKPSATTAARIVDYFLKTQSMPLINKAFRKDILIILEGRMDKWISRCLDEVGQDSDDHIDIPMFSRNVG